MNFPELSLLKNRSADSLARAENPKGMILFHTGVVLLLALLIALVDHLLAQAIENTGGLAGMTTRSMLSTAQSTLHILQIAFIPFWQMGYTFYTLQVARGNATGYGTFAEGLRRFGAVLRLNLFTGAIYMLVSIAAAYVSSFLFMMSPWGAAMLEPIYEMAYSGAMDTEALEQVINTISVDAALPIFLIFIPCFLLLCAPFFYRFRMAAFWLMDHPKGGALAAMHNSRKMLQGKRMALLRMDLRFWWFYLLDLLVTAICYGDLLLETLGVALPFSQDAAYFIFLGIYMICQLALYYWRQNEVGLTYAHLYLDLNVETPTEDAPQKPWPV